MKWRSLFLYHTPFLTLPVWSYLHPKAFFLWFYFYMVWSNKILINSWGIIIVKLDVVLTKQRNMWQRWKRKKKKSSLILKAALRLLSCEIIPLLIGLSSFILLLTLTFLNSMNFLTVWPYCIGCRESKSEKTLSVSLSSL